MRALLLALLFALPAHAQETLELRCPHASGELGRPPHTVAALVTVNFGSRSMRVDYLDAGDNIVDTSGDRDARIGEDSISINVGGAVGGDYVLNRYSGTLTVAIYDGSASKLRVTSNCERRQRGPRQF
jgi:hypothetical protein